MGGVDLRCRRWVLVVELSGQPTLDGLARVWLARALRSASSCPSLRPRACRRATATCASNTSNSNLSSPSPPRPSTHHQTSLLYPPAYRSPKPRHPRIGARAQLPAGRPWLRSFRSGTLMSTPRLPTTPFPRPRRPPRPPSSSTGPPETCASTMANCSAASVFPALLAFWE